LPSAAESSPDQNQPSIEANTQSNAQAGPALNQLQSLASLPLRRPLRDPDKPQAAQKMPLRARLVGTVNEPGRSLAIFKLASGEHRFVPVDAQFDDPAGKVTVKQIDEQKVTVEYAGETQQLTVSP